MTIVQPRGRTLVIDRGEAKDIDELLVDAVVELHRQHVSGSSEASDTRS